MKRPFIIGVMGGGSAVENDMKAAYVLGSLIAKAGWILLNGGRDTGIMDASARGARDQGGITIGVLPDQNSDLASEHIQIPIVTGMGSARNCINVLTSDVVVACPGGMGTLSEIALALKNSKSVILLNYEEEKRFQQFQRDGRLQYAATPEEAVEKIRKVLDKF